MFSDVFCIFLDQENGNVRYAIRLFYCALSVSKSKCTIYCVRLICKASVYKLFSELFLATSCLLYADTVPLNMHVYGGL